MQITNRFTPMMPQAHKPTQVQRVGNLELETEKKIVNEINKISDLGSLESLYSRYMGQYNLYRSNPEVEGPMPIPFMDNLIALMNRITVLENELTKQGESFERMLNINV